MCVCVLPIRFEKLTLAQLKSVFSVKNIWKKRRGEIQEGRHSEYSLYNSSSSQSSERYY